VVHPVLSVDPASVETLSAFKGASAADRGGLRESFIHVHVARIDDEPARAELIEAIARVLADVRAAVSDWRAMLRRVGEVIAELKANPPPLPVGEIAEAIQFMEWLVAGNFTFLGMRDYALAPKADGLDAVAGSGLGLLRAPEMRVLQRAGQLLDFTPAILAFLREPKLLIVMKSNVRSRVHRRTYMDFVGVKRFDADGNLIGEFRIVGLFTST